jgi:phosphoglucomutase
MLEGDCSVVVRPSGTEPKLKVYLSVSAQDRDEASRTAEAIKARIEEFFR